MTERKKNIKKFGTHIVSGIKCNKCGNTLPTIFAVDHLDPDFSVNKCPHTPVYEIKEGKLVKKKGKPEDHLKPTRKSTTWLGLKNL